jgi:hypothetical protein
VSEWVQLYDIDEGSAVYVNLANACSVYPRPEGGSVIWFFEHTGEPMLGRLYVRESPAEIFQILGRPPNANRS